MKISIASEEKYISEHFGHCNCFTIYEVENDQILEKSIIENPGHRPGFLPVFLSRLGVNIIIAGGIGETAQALFKEKGIDVIVGVKGLCDDVIQQYLKGELKSTGSICREHQHKGESVKH